MSSLEKTDPQVAAVIAAEEQRQACTLELIASENHVSPAVLAAMGSVLTDKYAEGYPNRRWYCGCQHMDSVEQLAIDRATKLFGMEHANVQPHSGTSANLAVYLAALKPGQKIMAMSLAHGGHLSHGMATNVSGLNYKIVSYGVQPGTETMDLDEIRRMAKAERPDLLVVGASAYPRLIDFAAFGAIAKEVGCPMMADVAHIAGLIVGKAHPDPAPHAAFVTTTTHKTLRGPRGGVILCRNEYAKAIDHAIFPGLQGGPLMNIIAGKAVCFLEALDAGFRTYAAQIVANAAALAAELMNKGWRLVSGGTDNHLMMIDLRSRLPEVTGHVAARRLAEAGIIANKNAIPFDPRPTFETSGVRLGTAALTSRGMKPAQMKLIADWIDRVLMSGGAEDTIGSVGTKVGELCAQFPIPAQKD